MHAPGLDPSYRHLVAGKRYRVARTFIDYDNITRTEGEVWTFVGASFLAYESGLSLFFNINAKLVQVRLQAIPEEQLSITDNLEAYLVLHRRTWCFWR